MRLVCFILLSTLNVYHLAFAISNDIVASLRCKLLCKDAGGYAPEVTQDGLCTCKLLRQLSGDEFKSVQVQSAFNKLPVLIVETHRKRMKRQTEDFLDDMRTKLAEHQDALKTWHQDILDEHLGAWREQQDNILGDIGPKLEETQLKWGEALENLKDSSILGAQNRDGNTEMLDNIKKWYAEQAKNNEDALKALQNEHVEPLLGDIAPKLEEHQQKWAETMDTLKSAGEWLIPSVDEINSWPETWKGEQKKIKDFHDEHLEQIVGEIAPKLEEHQQKITEAFDHIKNGNLLATNEKVLNDINEWHEKTLGSIMPGLEEEKGKFMDKLEELKPVENALEDWEDKKDEILGVLNSYKNEKIAPMLDDIKSKLEEHHQNIKDNLDDGPIVGQMAPSLTTYESHSAGIGGSNVNFPPPNHPNPFIPPLAHIIRALPFPRVHIPLAPPAALPYAPPAFPLAPPFPHTFRAAGPAPYLPSRFREPYNPSNPILVQPIVMPPGLSRALPTPTPILHNLHNSVDDMIKNMRKHNGRLVPDSYLNSDALSNSESQVNQINVNVRFEPTPTPPNLYSFFLPYNRNFLAASAPKEVIDESVTDNPGKVEDETDTEVDSTSGEQKARLQEQLSDADKTQFPVHVVDSVKKNLPNDVNKQGGNDAGAAGAKVEKHAGELDAGKDNAGEIIVQPKQFMQYADEDLETLAK